MLPVGVTIIFEDNLDHSNHAGKTWERTSVGRTPVGIDTTQTEFDVIGETGGSKAMQKHSHTQPQRMLVWDASPAQTATPYGSGGAGGLFQYYGFNSATTNEAGTGTSGNLQPYQVFAFWRRTA